MKIVEQNNSKEISRLQGQIKRTREAHERVKSQVTRFRERLEMYNQIGEHGNSNWLMSLPAKSWRGSRRALYDRESVTTAGSLCQSHLTRAQLRVHVGNHHSQNLWRGALQNALRL